MSANECLTVRQLSIGNDGKTLVNLAELQVEPGQIATVVGPSGSGKSTLLRWILGEPLQDFVINGELWLGDTRIDGYPIEQRQIGLMYQKGDLFPHLNVLENLVFALPRALSKMDKRQRAEDALAAVGLQHKLQAVPADLSGGEQSRIALIRSLLAEPKALLLDEPFAALDSQLRGQIREWTFAQIKRRQIPALLVTHDPADHGNGELVEIGKQHD